MRASTRTLLYCMAALSVIAALPYVGYLDGYFLADDLMLDYFLLEDGALSASKLLYHLFPTEGYVARQIYRPFDFLVMAVDWTFWGVNPVGYHLSNLAFHIWCTLIVFFLIRRIGRHRDLFPAMMGASLFALHPLGSEAVQWIVGRVDLTSCFFTLLALLAYVRFRQTERRRFLGLTLAAVAGGLLSKDVVVVIPAYFVLYDVCLTKAFRRWSETRWKMFAPHVYVVAVVALYFVVRLLCFGGFVGRYEGAGEPVGVAFADQWMDGISRVVGLLETMLFPVRESVHTANESAAVRACLILGYVGMAGLAVAHGLISRTKPVRRASLFGLLWLGATLAPLAYLLLLLPIDGDHLNGRLAYLPLAAMCVALPLWLFSGQPWQERAWARVRLAAVVIVPVVYLPLVLAHNAVFHRAGEAVQALQQQVLALHAEAPAGTGVVIENPPLEMNGAYVLRTGLPFVFRPPLAPREIPVIGLNLCSEDELGRFLYRHRARPLVVRWEERGLRVERVTRREPGLLPSWQGEDLVGFRVRGGSGRLENRALVITRDEGARSLAVETPAMHVRPSDVDSLVIDLRVRRGEAKPLRVRVIGFDLADAPVTLDLAAGAPVAPGPARRRVVPLRFIPEMFGRRVADGFSGLRRIARIELVLPVGWEGVEIRGLELRRGFPAIRVTTPENGTRFAVRGSAPEFRFMALDGVRYYALALDAEPFGECRARFDAWRLSKGRPVEAGADIVKPIDATGNLGPRDFALDWRLAPPNTEGRSLGFRWRIEALLDPERPWMITAESEARDALIR